MPVLILLHSALVTHTLLTRSVLHLIAFLKSNTTLKKRHNDALQRTDTWDQDNICAPCLYKTADEPPLKFSFLAAIDGNNSLKLVDSTFRSGSVCTDDRVSSSKRWISPEDVNIFKDEVNKKVICQFPCHYEFQCQYQFPCRSYLTFLLYSLNAEQHAVHHCLWCLPVPRQSLSLSLPTPLQNLSLTPLTTPLMTHSLILISMMKMLRGSISLKPMSSHNVSTLVLSAGGMQDQKRAKKCSPSLL